MLYWNTVNDRLKQSLIEFMNTEEFNDCRLVGGTSLSLQLGHRMSDDIDLFACNTKYDKLQFDVIENYFWEHYPYVKGAVGGKVVQGRTYFVGESKDDHVKVDVYYSSEDFFQPEVVLEGVRMATIEEMLDCYKVRFTWADNESHIISQLTNFQVADAEEEDPKCLRGKQWEFIKQDFVEVIERYRSTPGYTR